MICFGVSIILLCTRLSNAAEPANGSGKVDPEPENWVASWGCAPGFAIGQEFADQTLRQFVRLSVGGNRVRIRLSNETGTQPLIIGSAHVAVAGREKGTIDPSTDHVLTFAGSPKTSVSPGSPVLSDPVDLPVQPLTKLAITLYLTRDTGSSVMHLLGEETGYLSSSGDETGDVTIADASTVAERYFLTRVEVSSSTNAGTIVALGDSITDGRGSTPDADRRWPDRLAERLNEQGLRLGIVNAGIAGNRLLHDLPEMVCGPSALSRFDRDVLSVPGVKFLIIFEGFNDITHPMIEAKRQALNQWIRTGKAYDAVIDFEAVVRDPNHPTRVRPDYDSGDHGHLNDAGYRAMAEAVDLKLLQGLVNRTR